jgi:murein DD-endopeptidase MepM/ murein hydrolase activator NlpD
MLTPVSPGLSCARYSSGHYHKVAAGENLYRIGLRYGVPAEDLARINRIGDVTEISVGQRIWIPTRPGARPLALSSRQVSSKGPRSGANSAAASRARQSARREVQRQSNLDFVWPVRGGKLTSRFGRRNGRPHEGIDLAAGRGTRILAAEAGKVIHSGRLGDYGKVVILKHAGRYRTVYAHANKLFVRKGQFVEKGDRIAAVGSSGRSSGPHLHFEIRQRESPRDPMLYLP